MKETYQLRDGYAFMQDYQLLLLHEITHMVRGLYLLNKPIEFLLARIIIDNGKFGQLIIYPTFIHVSCKRQE